MKVELMNGVEYQHWLLARARDGAVRFRSEERDREFPGWSLVLERLCVLAGQALHRRDLDGQGLLHLSLIRERQRYVLRWQWQGSDAPVLAPNGYLGGWLNRNGARLMRHLAHRCVVCGTPAAAPFGLDPTCRVHVGVTAADLCLPATLEQLESLTAHLETRVVLAVRAWAQKMNLALQGKGRTLLLPVVSDEADLSPRLTQPIWLSALLTRRLIQVLPRVRMSANEEEERIFTALTRLPETSSYGLDTLAMLGAAHLQVLRAAPPSLAIALLSAFLQLNGARLAAPRAAIAELVSNWEAYAAQVGNWLPWVARHTVQKHVTDQATGIHVTDPLAYFFSLVPRSQARTLERRDEKAQALRRRHRALAQRKLIRPFLPNAEAQLEALGVRFPQAGKALEIIRRTVALARVGGEARLTPLLLAGPPGVGKSAFAKSIVAALWGPLMQMEVIPMPYLVAAFELAGNDSGWEASDAGLIARALARAPHANLVWFADEIDKASFQPGRHAPPTTVLLELLEDHSARCFRDICLENTLLDCHLFSWILTANDLFLLPAPLLSRCQIVEMRGPDGLAEGRAVLTSIWDSLRHDAAWGGQFETALDAGVIAQLWREPPRQMRQALESAAGRAVVRATAGVVRHISPAHRYRILPQDIEIPKVGAYQPMRFIR